MRMIMVDVRAETQGAAVISGSTSVILGPFNFYNRPTKVFTLANLSGTATLSGAIVQINPDLQGVEPGLPVGVGGSGPPPQVGPNPALWQTYDSATFIRLPPGQVRSLVANDIFRWWRILGVHDQFFGGGQGATITVSGWVNASTI